MTTKLCARLPVSLIDKLAKNESTPNCQVGQLIDTFYWNSLPYDSDLDLHGIETKQLTIRCSKTGLDALKKYASYHAKPMNVSIVQAFILLGQYRP